MQKSKFKRLFLNSLSLILLILILAAITLLAKSDFLLYLKNREARKSYAEKKLELEKLKKEKEAIEEELRKIENPENIEKLLRERFQAAKPGEHLLIITEEPRFKETSGAPETPRSFFKKFLNFFTPFKRN